jgi:uncharacterized protein YbjT (DUF2867 family)
MILVAGATGTLGSHLVPRLVSRDERVRALVRAPAARVDRTVVDVVEGDIRDAAAVARAVDGADVVVCAVSGFGGRAGVDVRGVDGLGTRNLIEAAARAGVEHFIFVSVFGAAARHPLALQREKHRSEEVLRASGVGWTILRPAPSADTWVYLVGGRVPTGGKALVLGRGRNPVSFVAAEDVASVVIDALAVGPCGSIVPVTGPEDVSLRGIVERIEHTLARDVPVVGVPRIALRLQSALARPFRPVRAQQARAALAMDTTDMRYRPPGARVGRRRIDEVVGQQMLAAV